jgi:hypothetical protein
VFDDGFVGHAADAGEGGDGAVEGFGGEVAEGEGLVGGEAGGAELLVGAVEDLLGEGVAGDRRRPLRWGTRVWARGAEDSSRRRWMVAAALPWSCW